MTSRWAPFGRARMIVIALLGVPLLWLSTAVSIDGVFHRRYPAQALAWWPLSANAAANLSAQLIVNPSKEDRRAAIVLARQALRRQAILPVAVRALAFGEAYADPTGNRSRRLIAYGEKLSRRDGPTQLWLIEDNVQSGNVAGALIHYDRIMRTSPEARAQVLPVLTAAVNDPVVARPLARLLARRPPWRDDFVSQIVTRVDNPVSLAMLLSASGLSSQSAQDRSLLQLGLTRIATQGAPDVAYRLYRRMGGQPPVRGDAVVNGDLAREPGLAPFDWTGNTDPALATGREMGDGGWRLHASLVAGATGTLARQLVLLTPGGYTIDARIAGPRSDGSTITLVLRCLDGETLFSALSQTGRVGGTITVPSGCRAAWLTLEGRGALDNGPSDYWIGPISVKRTAAS